MSGSGIATKRLRGLSASRDMAGVNGVRAARVLRAAAALRERAIGRAAAEGEDEQRRALERDVAVARRDDGDVLLAVELEADRRPAHAGAAEEAPHLDAGACVVRAEPAVALAGEDESSRGRERAAAERRDATLPDDAAGRRTMAESVL